MKRGAVAGLIALLLLSGCDAVKVVKEEPAHTGTLKSLKFEGGNEGDAPAGWEVTTQTPGEESESRAPKFKMEYTESEKHSGKMSALLRPIGKEKLGPNTYTDARICGDPPFPGSATRVSAFIKGDRTGLVALTAGLSTAIEIPESNLQKRGGGWTKYEVVVVASPPPPTPVPFREKMCIWLNVSGSTRAWIDDVTFTKLDLASIPAEKIQSVPLENLDMEKFDRGGTLSNWTLLSAEVPRGFELRADRAVKRSGRASLLLTTDEPLETPVGDRADYCMDPAPLLGRTLRVSGWLRADLVGEGTTSNDFSVKAHGVTLEEAPTTTPEQLLASGDFTSADVSVKQPIDWTQYQLISSVPTTAKTLCISFRLDQMGSLWADDLSVEVIDL